MRDRLQTRLLTLYYASYFPPPALAAGLLISLLAYIGRDSPVGNAAVRATIAGDNQSNVDNGDPSVAASVASLGCAGECWGQRLWQRISRTRMQCTAARSCYGD